ncbi:hypothetical protein [Paraburkholderia sp. J94]|uniref:hypothetical protein n=1 Tax=Paraburkholderia sp. J94 TaxID=2805441 RepID=UPI002AB06EC4|nr:hypothetical protein [Paraburkholderia sp. J94]
MKSTIIIACLGALLAGCTTLGKPYPFPKDSEPSADLRVSGAGVYLLSFNEKDCYAGKTLVDGNPDAAPVKVVPDKPLVISYEGDGCMMQAKFTPRQGTHYLMVAQEGRAPSDPNRSWLSALGHVNDYQCIMAAIEVDNDGHPATPVKLRKVSPRQKGLTCIKLR